ncbi:LexA family transcriptional regulator [Lactobacillus jensenii]|uniref:LexA family transcriptional regulator n=2 Tax=Lactobacillus jensenii TaxID=109790 RepID=UPI0021BD7113|nr:XRE family transcriptional regulator [Lactobacillus jensenii]
MIQQNKGKPYMLGKNLIYLMNKQHETVPQLAKVTGAALSSISDWRTSKKVPRSGYLEKIAKHYSVTLSDLLFTDIEQSIPVNNFEKLAENTSSTEIPILGTIACRKSILIEQNKDYSQYFPKNLTHLMKQHDETIMKLSDEISAAYSSISDWRNGKKLPRASHLKKLADHYHLNLSDLMERDLTSTSIDTQLQNYIAQPNSHYQISSHKIPVLGTIACGKPILAEQNIEDYLSLIPSDDATYFGLKCRGQSMEPTIHDGAIAIIRQQPTVEDGEIAAVLVGEDADEATLKRVKHINNSILLISDNENFDPILSTKKDPVRIVGKAVRILDIL